MIFTHSIYACPITVAHMKAIESSLTENEKAQVGFVFDLGNFGSINTSWLEIRKLKALTNLPPDPPAHFVRTSFPFGDSGHNPL